MTAELIFKNFSRLFPALVDNVHRYKRVNANCIQMLMKTGGTINFTYQRKARDDIFTLTGRMHDSTLDTVTKNLKEREE